MRMPRTVGGILLGLSLATTRAWAQTALQITFQVDAGTPVTITDSNDGITDLDPGDTILDFATTIDGVVTVEGSLGQYDAAFSAGYYLTWRPTTNAAVFHNTDIVAHRLTMTIDGEPFTPRGPAAAIGAFLFAVADDASGGDVEIEPSNDLQAFVDVGSGLVPLGSRCFAGANDGAACTDSSECPGGACAQAHADVPLTQAADQPVVIDTGLREVDRDDAGVRARLVWTMDLGPDDEIQVPEYVGAQYFAGALSLAVFKAQDGCVVAMNKAALDVAKAADRSDATCLAMVGDETSCVDDQTDPRTLYKAAKVVSRFASSCDVPPPFGTDLDGCCEGGSNGGAVCSDASECPGGACTAGACIYMAVEQASNAITHDMFGPTVHVSGFTTRCARYVRKAAGDLLAYRWKVLVAVNRSNLSQVTSETEFVDSCLGPPQPDPKLKIARYEAKLAYKVQQKCIDQHVTPLSTVFPGVCSGEADDAYAACLARRVACRFCLAVSVTDDVGGSLDCDAFDDGVANASCP